MFYPFTNQTLRRLTILCIGILFGMLVQVVLQFSFHILLNNRFFRFNARVFSSTVNESQDVELKFKQIPHHTALQVHTTMPPLTEIPSTISYAVADFTTMRIVAEQGAFESRPVASLTKLLTAVIVEDLLSPTTQLEVSKLSTEQIPTSLGLKVGEIFRVDELLAASLLTSANDATAVLAEGVELHYPGTKFPELMNKKAKLIQLTASNFSNPQGFDSPSNFSSAYDILQLTSYIWFNYPTITRIVGKEHMYLEKNEHHKKYDVINWNSLVGVYPGAKGMKIGNTHDAGKTTVVVAEREGKQIAVVLLGAKNVLERDMFTALLLDKAFEHMYQFPPIHVTEFKLQTKYDSWRLSQLTPSPLHIYG